MWWLLLACAEPAPPAVAPAVPTWQEEAALVSAGLAEVKGLWRAQNAPAARTLAERVYTERWEPRLEPVARQLEGEVAVAEIEYRFGLLLADLESNRPTAKIEERLRDLDARVRKVADGAARAFPPPSGAPPPPEPAANSRPVVPDVAPNWEKAAPGTGG